MLFLTREELEARRRERLERVRPLIDVVNSVPAQRLPYEDSKSVAGSSALYVAAPAITLDEEKES